MFRTKTVFAILLLSTHAFAAFGFNVDGTLDKNAISHAYFEGEFSQILPPLETFRQAYPNPTKDDQIFVYKYLSVIYAADPSTRKKAESYMVQLVKLMPTIELIDLYISDNIQAIFKDVKSNFLKQQQYVREHDVYGHPSGSAVDSTAIYKPRKKSHPVFWWTLGGLGVTAAAATTYILLSESTSSGDHHELGN
ncbi:MAG: hypothetical protein ABIW76_22375 [Fibrobacteria bacterium]